MARRPVRSFKRCPGERHGPAGLRRRIPRVAGLGARERHLTQAVGAAARGGGTSRRPSGLLGGGARSQAAGGELDLAGTGVFRRQAWPRGRASSDVCAGASASERGRAGGPPSRVRRASAGERGHTGRRARLRATSTSARGLPPASW
ncbi:unnamed protein product [Urochloa humidicola]